MIRPSLDPCLHGILMHMCLLQIHHAYALKYDIPSLIQHYIKFFICLCLAVHLIMLRTSIFYEILETDMVFFANSKYVNFNKNTLFFFSYLSSIITPQLKKHTVSVSSISLSFLNHLKKMYGALKNTELYIL